jgi:hypothetical protein
LVAMSCMGAQATIASAVVAVITAIRFFRFEDMGDSCGRRNDVETLLHTAGFAG